MESTSFQYFVGLINSYLPTVAFFLLAAFVALTLFCYHHERKDDFLFSCQCFCLFNLLFAIRKRRKRRRERMSEKGRKEEEEKIGVIYHTKLPTLDLLEFHVFSKN